MPPPSYCSKISTRSTNDHEIDNDFENSKSEISNLLETNSDEESKPNLKSETLGLVKTLLGPSLEDAVLRTLEFGKALIQKSDGTEAIAKDKKLLKALKKEIGKGSQDQLNLEFLLEKRNKVGEMKDHDNSSEGKTGRKCVVFNNKMDKNLSMYQKPRKLANVSKIRSLDSDLKQDAPSPEKIKRQLEALIQISKDNPSERAANWKLNSQAPKLPMEVTVMPSFCMYNNEYNNEKNVELNCSSTCEMQSNTSKGESEADPTTSRVCSNLKNRSAKKICQAPEFLSNALGPTIDVSIIDNLKMMRDIFKCESGRGEGIARQISTQPMKQQVRLQNSEVEMSCRIEELQKKIEELEQKERCLVKQIEDEEQEREYKRKAFEEEEKKLCSVKACLEKMAGEQKKADCGRSLMECGFEARYESLQARIASEEQKLSKLKSQYDNYKRELAEAKNKKEALKRNKSLLDAWDIFASRVCHTKLPSFSRAYNLERKQFKSGDFGNLHCCFPLLINQADPERFRPFRERKSRSRSRCQRGKPDCQCENVMANRCLSLCSNKPESRCPSHESHCNLSVSNSKEHIKYESQTNLKCKIKMGEVQFPLQRDISCGLHQMLKTCTCKCKPPTKQEAHLCSSEDDLFKKYRAMHSGGKQENYYSNLGLETSAELLLRKSSDKALSRSKSDTSLKKNKCSRIIKVMWATTRINIFQDNCRTYEIMDATSNPPTSMPAKTEGIFVVKTPQKKVCQSHSKRKCHPSVPGL